MDATALLRASTVVAALGPLTNVADALDGAHSISCDVAAAQAVSLQGYRRW